MYFGTSNNQNNDLYTAQSVTEDGLLSQETWHHVSATFNNGIIKIYVDGENVFIQDHGYKEMYPNNHWVNFGRTHRSGGASFFNEFNGIINEILIWDKELDQNQIQSSMFSTISEQESGLVGYWNFNEGSGSVLNDLTINSNQGVIYGATWSGDVPTPIEPVYGCTDSYAENYNPDATSDDGSCSGYPENGQYSLSFDGTDDYVNLGDSDVFSFDNTMTLSSWVKTNEQDREQTILCKFDNNAESYLIAINPDNFYYFSFDY